MSFLLREGESIEVAPGDLRTITAITAMGRPSGGQDGRVQSWNDAGQIAATMIFSDGTRGAFRMTVPEPTTDAVWIAAAALAWLARRRACGRIVRSRGVLEGVPARRVVPTTPPTVPRTLKQEIA